ncbi:helix-turn-helix domain-containing protein [Hymenobacter sp. BT186]|uniref:Helix-turn-helix domain-containing protein n=1 Tax=Hymenobacter telluris TaxID=2816474 RepID=A0A939ES65_9BACT|nr:AraC family transcriptional regulator [Hymenobacter telluris]MBO0356535.1 helix-turn-helix domain-containing protein [Hymenobacter telluris]MBW3372560.1 helix-turn-helix domain-containing protein [Hymenobacter norwichensis]
MTFTFSAYSSLLLPFFLQGIVVSVVLLTRGRRHGSTADGWLALLLLLHTVRLAQWMLGFAGWYDAHNALSTFMFYFPFSNWLALGPALYFYFRSLTNQEFQFSGRHLLHFLPALLYLAWRLVAVGVDVVWAHGVRGLPYPYHFGTKGQLAAMQEGLSFWVEVVGSVSVAWYAWLTLREYWQYRRYINNYFSDTEQIRFVWLRNLLVAMLLGVGITFLFSVVDVSVLPLNYYQAWYEFLATGILIYFLSIAGLLTNDRLAVPLQFWPASAPAESLAVTIAQVPQQVPPPETAGVPSVAEGAVDAPSPALIPEPVSATDAADPDLARWVARLTKLMDTDRPYLAPELTLPQLAAQVGTNTSVLSRVINTGFGQNFNDYVNEYRVREAERLLRDPRYQQYTLLAVALESGFNSKSTFNRVFKKLRGATPSEVATGLKP